MTYVRAALLGLIVAAGFVAFASGVVWAAAQMGVK